MNLIKSNLGDTTQNRVLGDPVTPIPSHSAAAPAAASASASAAAAAPT